MPLIHVDTDMGVDDALALVAAERLDGVSLAAISTVAGNVSLRQATLNALILRRFLGSEARVPVWAGSSPPPAGPSIDARHIHGEDGLGGATFALGPELRESLPKIDAIPGIAEAEPVTGPVTILGIGPATNIPSLVERYGPRNVDRIVLMSGAFFDVGNITGAAEFNAFGDPVALERVLASVFMSPSCRSISPARWCCPARWSIAGRPAPARRSATCW